MKKILSIFVLICLFMTAFSCNYAATENNLLESLKVNQEGLSPEFSPEQFNYSLFVKDSINSINIDAVAKDDNANVQIEGNNNLKKGDNEVIVTVTPKSGEKQEYKIIVTKTSNVEASDSYLQNLILENIELTPAFTPETLEYDGGSVPNKVNSILTFASARQDDASVQITGNDNLKEGENIILVKVTSEDESTTKEYKIKINKDKVEDAITDVVETTQNSEISTENNSSNVSDNKLIYIVVIIVLICIVIVLMWKIKKYKNSK